MTGQWVLLWSCRQNALHIETAAEMLVKNRMACTDGRPSDWITLAIGTFDEVNAQADKVRGLLLQRVALREKTRARTMRTDA